MNSVIEIISALHFALGFVYAGWLTLLSLDLIAEINVLKAYIVISHVAHICYNMDTANLAFIITKVRCMNEEFSKLHL